MPFDGDARWQIEIGAVDRSAQAFAAVDRRMRESSRQATMLGQQTSMANNVATAAMTRLSSALAPLAAGFTAAAVASRIWEAGMKAANMGEQAEQIGLTTDQLQAYRLAAAQAGIEAEQMDAAMMRLAKAMGTANDGSDEMIAKFEKLGVKILDSEGNLRKTADVMPELARGLLNVSSETERGALMQELMGRSGMRLVTVLTTLAEGNDAVVASAKAHKAVIGEEVIKAWDELDDQMKVAAQRMDTFLATVGKPVAMGALLGINFEISKMTQLLSLAQKGFDWLTSKAANSAGGLDKQIEGLNADIVAFMDRGHDVNDPVVQDIIKRRDALADSTSYTEKVTTSANIVVPANAVRAVVQIYKSAGSNLSGGSYRIGTVVCMKKYGAELVVDGSILTNHLSSDSVDTNNLKTGAVTAAKASIGTLSSLSADFGSMTAGTVTGAVLRTSGGNTRIEMRGDGFWPNSITAYVNLSGVSTAIATFGGDLVSGLGVLQIAGNLPGYYPIRAVNESTSGGGGGLGGGAAKLMSTGGWTVEVGQSATGAGSPLPTAALTAYNSGSGGGGLYAGMSQGAGGWSGYAYRGTGYGPFTGSHDGLLSIEVEPEVGDLLVDGPVIRKLISDVICEMALSSVARQPNVLGVFVARREPVPGVAPAAMTDDDGWPVPEWAGWCVAHDLVVMHALGEGCLNACGQGGDIQPGDHLCASDMPGKAMRQLDEFGQPDNVRRTYTIGKLRGDAAVTFAAPDDVAFIPVTYKF